MRKAAVAEGEARASASVQVRGSAKPDQRLPEKAGIVDAAEPLPQLPDVQVLADAQEKEEGAGAAGATALTA